jgi:hypothetical protein
MDVGYQPLLAVVRDAQQNATQLLQRSNNYLHQFAHARV